VTDPTDGSLIFITGGETKSEMQHALADIIIKLRPDDTMH